MGVIVPPHLAVVVTVLTALGEEDTALRRHRGKAALAVNVNPGVACTVHQQGAAKLSACLNFPAVLKRVAACVTDVSFGLFAAQSCGGRGLGGSIYAY